jgi:hypothetical protein
VERTLRLIGSPSVPGLNSSYSLSRWTSIPIVYVQANFFLSRVHEQAELWPVRMGHFFDRAFKTFLQKHWRPAIKVTLVSCVKFRGRYRPFVRLSALILEIPQPDFPRVVFA